MVEPALKGEEAGEDLADLRRPAGEEEGPKREGADAADDEAELDDAVDLELCGQGEEGEPREVLSGEGEGDDALPPGG